jgi:hypothetical protein
MASDARLSLNLWNGGNRYGLELSCTGFNHRLPQLLFEAVDKVISLTVDPARFALTREGYVRLVTRLSLDGPWACFICAVTVAAPVHRCARQAGSGGEELADSTDSVVYTRTVRGFSPCLHSLPCNAPNEGIVPLSDAALGSPFPPKSRTLTQ